MDPQTEAIRALARAATVLERSSTELSLAHYRVLSSIASGQERASHVARNLALGKPAVSAAVDALRRRGLLERLDVAGDHRAATLRLTGDGQRLLAEVEEEMRLRLGDLCGRTPDAERMLEALVWLGRALDDRRAERRAAREQAAETPA